MQEKHKQEKKTRAKKKKRIPLEKGAPKIVKEDRRTKVKSKSFT